MKKTIGQQISEHNQKNIQFEDDVREYSIAMGPKKLADIYEFALETTQVTEFKNKDFYVMLMCIPDMLLGELKWIIDIPRHACPTPRYSTSVYKYHHTSGELEYLWNLPSEGKCKHIMRNIKIQMMNPATRVQATFVYQAESGALLQWVIKENGEKPDALVSFKKE